MYLPCALDDARLPYMSSHVSFHTAMSSAMPILSQFIPMPRIEKELEVNRKFDVKRESVTHCKLILQTMYRNTHVFYKRGH